MLLLIAAFAHEVQVTEALSRQLVTIELTDATPYELTGVVGGEAMVVIDLSPAGRRKHRAGPPYAKCTAVTVLGDDALDVWIGEDQRRQARITEPVHIELTAHPSASWTLRAERCKR